MATIKTLRCTISGRDFTPDAALYFNKDIGQVATLDVLYDYEALRQQLDRDALAASRDMSMWRYLPLLPLAEDATLPPLRVGLTPLYDAPRIAEYLGVRSVQVKDDGLNPTASLKDRASAMVLARALEMGVNTVSTASTGNAAAALSGIGASLPDMRIVIFVPATAPEAKIAQLLVYGATVLLVEDTYDTAFDLCYELCMSEGWYCRNTGINPYTTEGKKTVAYEIAEQNNWDVPDVVVVSVGDGSIIGGVHKGFWELYQLGWIERIPRLIGVQSEGSAPLVKAWQQGVAPQDMQPIEVNTVADSIAAGLPRDRVKAMRAVKDTGGAFISVSDDEIVQAIPRLAQLSGVFAEPAAAASFAGAYRAVQSKLIGADERVTLLITGNGLKDVKRAREGVGSGIYVPPDLDSIRRELKKL
ncbi:MAG: threonine synthase [Chloroflexi bacterium]|nr:MAG: threonine synthase [Chloroflexota bacterium]